MSFAKSLLQNLSDKDGPGYRLFHKPYYSFPEEIEKLIIFDVNIYRISGLKPDFYESEGHILHYFDSWISGFEF